MQRHLNDLERNSRRHVLIGRVVIPWPSVVLFDDELSMMRLITSDLSLLGISSARGTLSNVLNCRWEQATRAREFILIYEFMKPTIM